MKNIVENNKLIAEFMGWKENKDMEAKLISGGITYYFQKNDEACIPETMCYHSDWNWLMRVIVKILQVCAEMDEVERYWGITDAMPYIDNVFTACVEFVRWYNEQNK